MERRPARGFRSGPVAAGLATAAILAATALPGPPRFTPAAPPAAVVRTLGAGSIPELMGAGSLRLGGALEPFHLDEANSSQSWQERGDGTASLEVRLQSSEDPLTYLEGVLTLRGQRQVDTLDDVSWQLFAAAVPQIEGVEPRLEAADPAGSGDALVYGSLAGSLAGAGQLSGAMIAVRNVPGTLVRRGAWSGSIAGERMELEDTLFARVLWLREPGACAMDLEDHGRGTLGLRLGQD
ncbi:MAG: hypothetical protein AAGG01_09790 [Planctomycetota bacterium]